MTDTNQSQLPTPAIDFAGASDTGRRRTNNEDTFIATPLADDRYYLFAAIDGVGGYEGGEVASAIAADVIPRSLEASLKAGFTTLDAVKNAVADANNTIYSKKFEAPQLSDMGCVATVAVIDLHDNTLSMAHVGDSRLYCYDNGKMTKLSHDHSVVGEMEDGGVLTEEDAFHHPSRNVILRALGTEQHTANDPDFIEGSMFPLIPGAQYLFCSDGLTDMLLSRQIAEVLGRGMSPTVEVKTLIDMANEAGGKDNVTVVIAQIPSPPAEEKPATERVITQPRMIMHDQETKDDHKTTGDDTDNSDDPKQHAEIPDTDVSATSIHTPYHNRSHEKRLWTTLLIVSIFASLLLGFIAGFFTRPLFERPAKPEVEVTAPADTIKSIAQKPDSIAPPPTDSVNTVTTTL